MKVWGVIPARFGSTRFPGKPLVPVLGKPLLQWVVEGAREAKLFERILVATDDRRIADLCKSCQVDFVMTSSDIATGSDRVWAAIENEDCDVAFSIQGDEPLIRGSLLDQLVQPFLQDSHIDMVTAGRDFANDEEVQNLNTAKIVLNQRNEALYFSRFPIPFSRQAFSKSGRTALKHIGIYGYRKAFLKKFCEHGTTALELSESLEQLRALYLGARMKVIKVEEESWGVDTPEDITRAEEKLKMRWEK